VLRAALRDFIGPESAFEDDETVATFGSTTGTMNMALREPRLYAQGPNTRFVALGVMGQGSLNEIPVHNHGRRQRPMAI
jgi:hypothetical protein